MLDLTTGRYEDWADVQGALAILEESPQVFLGRDGVFPDDASEGLKGAVYHVMSSVLPNRWRAVFRQVLAPHMFCCDGCRMIVHISAF